MVHVKDTKCLTCAVNQITRFPMELAGQNIDYVEFDAHLAATKIDSSFKDYLNDSLDHFLNCAS